MSHDGSSHDGWAGRCVLLYIWLYIVVFYEFGTTATTTRTMNSAKVVFAVAFTTILVLCVIETVHWTSRNGLHVDVYLTIACILSVLFPLTGLLATRALARVDPRGHASARIFACMLIYGSTFVLRFLLGLCHEFAGPVRTFVKANLASVLVIECAVLEALPSAVVLLLLLCTVVELERRPSVRQGLTDPLKVATVQN